MPISNRSAFRHCLRNVDVTSLTAVYGPVRTVVWQGSAGDRRPYADQTAFEEVDPISTHKSASRIGARFGRITRHSEIGPILVLRTGSPTNLPPENTIVHASNCGAEY